MTIGKRLKNAIKNKGLKLTEFAKKSEIPYRNLQGYIADEMIPGGKSLIKIAELGVSTDWLLTGKGEMYQTKATSKETTTEKEITNWLSTWWKGADEEHRHWLNVQMKRYFPEYASWCEQEKKKEGRKS
ncbi:helix-turn-helix transcriptional regulator [Candidatus Parabeggiatoa sp. HSG14]|uniref:helix-turn-helix domain-containing protein n=1 Tax=Candidatus Parabeggiatoa sp. HSG14 TaxID=3055593 RepID=UPI0025A8FD18|nr:helix-turn-helix transcriptional regulator [Thiotrichales bacterium HSG14]